MPSWFADAAVAAVGTALLAAARWHGARSVTLDAAAATGVFLAERRLLVNGRAVLRTREEWRAHPQSAAVAPAFPDY